MHRPPLQVRAARSAAAVRGRLAEDTRRLLEDAGISQAQLARASGVPESFLSRILAGQAHPSIETYARLATAMGADLAARIYPNTGPALHDRHQARILEALLAGLGPNWQAHTEVAVRRPDRGWIDAVLHERTQSVAVATEIESELRRLEQQVRWASAKAEALPSWPGWPSLAAPAISRLLIVRWTRSTRQIVRSFPRQLAIAYPASPEAALAALQGGAPWPGPALLWARIEPAGIRLVAGR
jgi:transcriptional regulator with XRE-family HTH domain